MAKILIIEPRENKGDEEFYDYFFPIGLAYISAVLKKNKYEVDCLNLNHFSGDVEEIIKKHLIKKYKYVCCGATIVSYSCVEEIIKSIRKYTKAKFILGGLIITEDSEVIFNSLKPDFGVIGEGEKTIIELLNCLEKRKSIRKVKGIIYSKNNKIVITPEREKIENLDEIPFPDVEGLGIAERLENISCNRWWKSYFDYPRPYEILTGRGCPFNCTFCYHYNKYRNRSMDNVMKEIELNVKKHKVNLIRIHDECFTLNKERLFEFCKRIKKLASEVGWEIKWMCQSRVTIDRETIKVMKDAGCFGISFGFESYNQKVLDSMNKRITKKQIEDIMNICFEERMGMAASFIFGDIAETLETAQETLDFFREKCKGQIHIGFMVPCPGSKIYDYCFEKSIIKDKLSYLKNFNMESTYLNMTKMSEKEFEELKDKILKYQKYYKFAVPISEVKTGKNRYSLKVKCPLCKEIIEYKNFDIKNKFNYSSHMICKKCFMKFYIVSVLKRIGYFFYSNKIRKLRDFYLKIMERR